MVQTCSPLPFLVFDLVLGLRRDSKKDRNVGAKAGAGFFNCWCKPGVNLWQKLQTWLETELVCADLVPTFDYAWFYLE